jgi:tRNA nucleotidyltransferase (CCA-adding enzyme)
MGRHLIELGMPPGPAFKPILDACYEAQIEGRITCLEDGIAMVKCLQRSQHTTLSGVDGAE